MSDEKKYSKQQIFAAAILGAAIGAGLYFMWRNREKMPKMLNSFLKQSGIDLDKAKSTYEQLDPEKIYERAAEIARETALEVIKKYFPD
jgi:inosine/xanthosine triphosphate pyrophosphatase family protein